MNNMRMRNCMYNYIFLQLYYKINYLSSLVFKMNSAAALLQPSSSSIVEIVSSLGGPC